MKQLTLALLIVLALLLVVYTMMYYRSTNKTYALTNLEEFMKKSDEGGPEKIILTEEEWEQRLTPEQYYILRKKGTERSHTGKFHDLKSEGVYVCAACELSLFSSAAKYDSMTGWPSFWEPIDPTHIDYEEDYALIIPRTEVLCARCGSHLGHVFKDGPPPTGLRYCINSLALKFVPEDSDP